MAESAVRLTLVMCDRAHIDPETLAAAENTASKIFARANVQVIWRDGSAYTAQRQGVPEPSSGRSCQVGHHASARIGSSPLWRKVLVRRIRHRVERHRFVRSAYSMGTISAASAATRPGYTMAHELGHILLGPNAHANAGIMRGTLVTEDWEKAAQGTLGFTQSQNEQICTWIERRSRR